MPEPVNKRERERERPFTKLTFCIYHTHYMYIDNVNFVTLKSESQ